MELVEFLQSLKAEELRFIADQDYGQDSDRHFEALQEVVACGGQFPAGEHWYPYEVVELTANALSPGHEREFAVCTLLVIAAVVSGHDKSIGLDAKFRDLAESYGNLEPTYRESILSAYAAAGL